MTFLLRHMGCDPHQVLKENSEKWRIWANVGIILGRFQLHILRKVQITWKEEMIWCMHKWSVRLTHLWKPEGFAVSLQKIVRLFLQTIDDLVLDLALQVNTMDAVMRTHHSFIPYDQVDIFRIGWKLTFVWHNACVRFMARNENRKGRMCSLSSTKSLRWHCWSCNGNDILVSKL